MRELLAVRGRYAGFSNGGAVQEMQTMGEGGGDLGMMSEKKTPLGDIYEDAKQQSVMFMDLCEQPCSIMSLKDSERLDINGWLGLNETKIRISRRQAKALVAVLEMWILTGSFYE